MLIVVRVGLGLTHVAPTTYASTNGRVHTALWFARGTKGSAMPSAVLADDVSAKGSNMDSSFQNSADTINMYSMDALKTSLQDVANHTAV